jgi:hypothetical protein
MPNSHSKANQLHQPSSEVEPTASQDPKPSKTREILCSSLLLIKGSIRIYEPGPTTIAVAAATHLAAAQQSPLKNLRFLTYFDQLQIFESLPSQKPPLIAEFSLRIPVK